MAAGGPHGGYQHDSRVRRDAGNGQQLKAVSQGEAEPRGANA